MMGDGNVCSNEVKKIIVIKNAGEGKNNMKKWKEEKKRNRQDNILLDAIKTKRWKD